MSPDVRRALCQLLENVDEMSDEEVRAALGLEDEDALNNEAVRAYLIADIGVAAKSMYRALDRIDVEDTVSAARWLVQLADLAIALAAVEAVE